MRCHHCPDRVFASQEELEAHLAEHAEIQQKLRRRGGRTYGARLESQSPVTTPTPSSNNNRVPILPVFNNVASQARTAPITHRNSPEKDSSADMEFHSAMAGFMNHDDTYLFLRRFSSLNVQNLLWMQSDIDCLEQKLADMIGPNAVNNTASEEEKAQLKLLITDKLQSYNDALLRYSQLCKLDKPDEESVADIRRWVADNANGTTPSPAGAKIFGSDKGDYAALAHRAAPKTWVYRLIERISWRFFAKRAPGGKRIALPSGGTLHVWDDSMVHIATRGVLTLISSLTLLVPLIILSFVENKLFIVVITALCSIVLAIFMAVATECRDYEIIMAVSAYAAVLMVYTQA
ncbi:hypothetical protein NUW58_g2810 [Xylaria curta]|uniref:Uncharacterized protein n=1 Tax=Xylaria curta TaxID=42375 RepID=A0ACC1PGH4_9PEZI|nr:hypothetical protein NUW58_g2810 [Xylaria curta]